ncbi:MAG TPA: PAS domain S-box protein [Vicinamibacterales bacterium]|jgi:hypothetical protein
MAEAAPLQSERWPWFVFGVVAMALAVGGWQFSRFQEREVLAARYNELTTIGRLKVEQIVAWRAERVAGVRVLADWPLFASTVDRWLRARDDSSLRAAVQRYLTVTQRDLGYADVLIVSRDGAVLMSARGEPTPGEAPLRAVVEEAVASRRAVLSDFFRCATCADPRLDAVAPLIDSTGGVMAALVTRSDPRLSLYAVLNTWPTVSRTAESSLVRRDNGAVLFLNELRHRRNTALRFRIPVEAGERPAVRATLGTVGRFEGVDYRGIPVLADIRPVPGSPWFMIVKADLDEVLAESRQSTRVTVALVTLGVLLAGTALGYLSRRRQRNVYRALYDSESRFRTLIEHAGEAVFVQTNGRFAYLNPAAQRLFGAATAAELVTQPVIERIPPLDRVRVQDQILTPGDDRQAMPLVEETCLRLDGTPVPVELSAAPILYEGQSGTVIFARDISERVDAQRALNESEAYYRALFENSPFPMWVFDLATLEFLAVNAAACQQYGYTRDEFARMDLRDIRPPEDVERLHEIVSVIGPDTAPRTDLVRHKTKGGALIDVEVTGQRVRFGDRDARMVVINDVTERRRLEHQLQQSQKMEAIGQLAGGIAHDFNNLLTIINNCADLAADDLTDSHPARGYLTAVREAGDRATRLTAQLLAFSRRQVRQPEVLDVNEIVRRIDPMLRRLIGEDIDLVTVCADAVQPVVIDRGQIEQVLVNLVVNARDAMPDGGKLTIETTNVELDDHYAGEHVGVVPGRHVMLSVADTGCGMDAETQAQIFEPFFTTKTPGKGTGLGLSTVYGIVKQNGGHVWVYSEPGKGSTFKVYFPGTAGTPSAPRPSTPTQSSGGTETILVVEDEPQVRGLVQRILEHSGYTVLTAANASEALAVVGRAPGPIDALLTDVVMPEISGRQLADRLCATSPGLKVLFMSGYTANAIVHHGVLDPGIAFIGKPFTADDLRRRLREVLDT